MIVEAIWQHRRPSTMTFLADALRDSGSIVWKQALDGLVTLASSEPIQVLRSAMEEGTDIERRAWIEEAIAQAIDAMDYQELS